MESALKYSVGIESVTVHIMEQLCKNASFGEPGWWEMSRMHAILVHDSIAQCGDGENLLVSDCDVQWFGDLSRILKDRPECDLIAQSETDGVLCPGFARWKATPETKMLCRKVVEQMSEPAFGDESKVLNALLSQANIRCGTFDPQEVWSTRKLWTNGDPAPEIPGNILVHHANWIVDVPGKAALLKLVRENISCKKSLMDSCGDRGSSRTLSCPET